jgi:hypothetical protein
MYQDPTLYQGALTLSDIDPEYMPFERFGNIMWGPPSVEPGLGVRATGISCVARSELRAVGGQWGRSTHCSSPPLLPQRVRTHNDMLKRMQ